MPLALPVQSIQRLAGVAWFLSVAGVAGAVWLALYRVYGKTDAVTAVAVGAGVTLYAAALWLVRRSALAEQTRERHKGVISSIRHQFQLMKPENLTRVANELDGEEFDLNAVIDYVIDRRADGQQSERIYTKRLRRRRDVAVSFLLDQSSSTARTIGRHPLQPYTRPGRRIIEIER